MEGNSLKRAIFSAVICALALQMFLTTSTGDTWIQTTQTDFESGLIENTSVTLSPGNVTLALSQDWWDANWSYRMPINITENSGNTLTDYQVLVEVNTTPLISAGKMRLDGGDIRFISSSGVEIPYWIEVFDNLSYDEPTDYNASWRFDEGSGLTVYDDSTNNNDGTLLDYNISNADGDTPPQWVDGKYGRALIFDGMDDYVEVPSSDTLNITTNITLEAWVNFTSLGTPGDMMTIWNKRYPLAVPTNNVWVCSYDCDGKLYVNLNTGGTSEGKRIDWVPQLSNWYHIGVTYDGNFIKVYIDGIQKSSFARSGNLATSDFPLIIGADNDPGGLNDYFNGSIDEVRIYNRALSAEEIRAIYHEKSKIWVNISSIPASSTTTVFMYYGNPSATDASDFDATFTKDYGESGLVGLWHMDEGTGLTALDSSGNGNDGTLTNGPVWQSEDGGQWNGRNDVKFSTGSALEFDGVDDYCTFGTPLAGANSLSIELWIKPNAVGAGAECILSNEVDGEMYVDLQSNGSISFQVRLTGPDIWYYVYSDPVSPNQWYYVTSVFDDSTDTLQLYINGEMKDENIASIDGSYSITHTGPNRELHLASGLVGTGNFNGTIDEVRIYNRSLNEGEIKAHYERRKYASPEPTVSIGVEEGKYVSSGTFISSVFPEFPSGSNGTLWNTISWIELLPNGTNITFATRTGNTSMPDANWSSWSAEVTDPLGSVISSPRGRYIQYRATLMTTNTGVTPILSEVIVNYTLNSVNPPTLSSPADDSWTNNTTPTFAWQFNDPDTDIQINFTIEIDDDPFFGSVNYTSGDVSSPLEYWAPGSPISDGIWYWRVRTMDEYSLWSNWSENWTIKIDATPPDPFNPIANPSSWTNYSQPEITFMTTDTMSGIDHYEVRIDAGSFTTQTSPYTLPAQADGIHNITVRAFDLVGIYMDGYVEVFIDTTPPAVPTDIDAVPDTWTNSNSFSINWTYPFEIDTSGIKNGAWYKIGSPPENNSDGIWQGNKPITVTSIEGAQTIYIWLEDNVGNRNYINYNTTILYLDTTPPDAFSPTADPDDWTADNQPQIIFSTTDADSGISHYEIQVDSDGFKNQTNPYTLPPQTDGTHTVTVGAYDNVGNYWEGTVDIYIDTTPPEEPTGVSAIPNSWTNINSFEIEWTNPTESDTSGIKTGAWYKIGSPPTSNSDGTWLATKPITVSSLEGEQTIYIWLEDNVGNVNYLNYATTTLNLDTTAPSAPIDLTPSPDTWTNVNSFSLEWTNPSDDSGVKTGAWYKIGSAPTSNSDGTWILNKPFSVDSIESEQSLYVWLEDNLGNVDYNNYATTTLYLDTTPPVSPMNVIASPGSWTIVNSFSIDWINPTDDSGIKTGAWYKISSSPTSNTDGTWLGTKPITVVSLEGEQTVYIWLEDNVENKNHLNYGIVNLYLDSIAPNITHSPVTKATSGEAINISAAITDNVGVKNVKLYYRKRGDETFVDINMTKNGDVYYAEIPSTLVQTLGIEYYISASDEINTATYPSADATTVYLQIEVEEDDEPWISSWFWLLLLLVIVLIIIFMLLALRRSEEEGVADTIAPEEEQVELTEDLGYATEEPEEPEPGKEIGSTQTYKVDQIPPAPSQEMADDEIFQNIKQMHEEGKISDETFDDFKKRYGKE